MRIPPKFINHSQLDSELVAAGLQVNLTLQSSPGTLYEGLIDSIWSMDSEGALVEPPEEILPIVESHVALVDGVPMSENNARLLPPPPPPGVTTSA